MHFFAKKVGLFLVVALKDRLKSNPPNKKTVLKLTLALAGGALRVLGVHLHIFPVNYALKFFSPPWGGAACMHPLHPWLRLWFRACAMNPAISIEHFVHCGLG